MTPKTLLITGCSSGIGLDAALRMRKEGWDVHAACRKPEDCARLEAQGFHSPRIDYTDEASIETGLAQVLKRTNGRLDGLYNNGATAIPGPLEAMPTDAMRTIFETNFFGWHTLTRAAVGIMRKQGSGRIVQCSSVLGFVAPPWRGAYNATKYALEAHADTLRLELSGSGIDVVLIEPGPIASNFLANSIAQFETWVDWKSSALRDRYESELLGKLYSERRSRMRLPPSAVSDVLLTALTSHSPKARYRGTTPTKVMWALKRILPVSVMDKLLIRG